LHIEKKPSTSPIYVEVTWLRANKKKYTVKRKRDVMNASTRHDTVEVDEPNNVSKGPYSESHCNERTEKGGKQWLRGKKHLDWHFAMFLEVQSDLK
jgi:hypothetical protein